MKKLTPKTLPTKIFDLDVEPQIGDIQWAERIKNMSSKKLDLILFEAINENNVWRVLYLINIPKSNAFFDHKGTTQRAEDIALRSMIEHNRNDILKAFAYHKVKHSNRYDICHIIRKNKGYDAFKFLITKAGYTDIPKLHHSSGNYHLESALPCAVLSGNLNMVKLITENGANLSLYPQILDLAKENSFPEIYKYLKKKLNEHNAKFETDTPEESTVKLLEKQQTEPENTWEKISDQIIAEHHKLDNGQSSLSYIFNFELRQMISVYKTPPSMVTLDTQNFKDIEGIGCKIDDAFNTLVEKGGQPNDYAVSFVKKPKDIQPIKIDK